MAVWCSMLPILTEIFDRSGLAGPVCLHKIEHMFKNRKNHGKSLQSAKFFNEKMQVGDCILRANTVYYR